MLSTPDYLESVSAMSCKPFPTSHNSYLYNTALPLWNTRNMFDKEYLQVEVLADNEVPFQKSTDDILNMNMYTCHICDTQVPNSYIKEHNDGEKHNAFVKIADLALERTRKHIKSNTKESKLSIHVTETYYCEPCELIVQNIDKTKHETSEKHVKSMKHDQLLRNFLMVYEDKENIDSVVEIKRGLRGSFEDLIDLPEIIESTNCETVSNNSKALNKTPIEAPNANQNINRSKTALLNVSNPKADKVTCEVNLELLPDAYRRIVAPKISNVASEDNLEPLPNIPKIGNVASENNLETLPSTPKKGNVASEESLHNTQKINNVASKNNLEPLPDASKRIVAPKTDNVAIEDELDELSDMSKRMIEQLSQSLAKYFPEKPTNLVKKGDKKGKAKPSKELINYLRTITEKCSIDPIHSLEALSDKLILITALNGDKIKVPVANFHSIHNQKDKSYCKICEDPNVGYRHEYFEEHMEKVMIPIEDKNAIRKIDDIWSHCIMCNDLTKNVNFHLQSLLHRNKLKQCLIETGTDINDNIVQKSQPQKENTSQLIQEHSLIVSHDTSQITCNICTLTIPNHVAKIKNHIATFDHITNYNDIVEKNKLNEIDDLQYYCVPCDMCVAKCYALGHCNGKKHNKHLTDLLNNEIITEDDQEQSTQIILPSISQQIKKLNTKPGSKSQKTDSELICFVCNIVLYSVDKHMNSLDHKKSYFSYLEANKLNEIEEDTFYCIPCNTVILIDYLMNHCTSKKHRNLLKTFMINAENKDVQTGSSGQLIAENSHISRSITRSVQNQAAQAPTTSTLISQNGIFDTAIPLKCLYQFREMSNARNLLCTICDEEVPYRKPEVQSHVNSIEHVVAFNLIMLWNKVKRLNDKYYCDVCKVDITYFNELSHVTSSQHVSIMAEQPKGTVYEYDKKLLTLEHAMSHKVGDRVRASSLISISKKDTQL